MTQWNLQDWKALARWIRERAKEYICISFALELNYMLHLLEVQGKNHGYSYDQGIEMDSFYYSKKWTLILI